jgi:phage I-like protein
VDTTPRTPDEITNHTLKTEFYKKMEKNNVPAETESEPEPFPARAEWFYGLIRREGQRNLSEFMKAKQRMDSSSRLSDVATTAVPDTPLSMAACSEAAVAAAKKIPNENNGFVLRMMAEVEFAMQVDGLKAEW